jgi:zinc transporter 1
MNLDIGVIIAALIMWKLDARNGNRFYADPAASLVISLIIAAGAIPLSQSPV